MPYFWQETEEGGIQSPAFPVPADFHFLVLSQQSKGFVKYFPNARSQKPSEESHFFWPRVSGSF